MPWKSRLNLRSFSRCLCSILSWKGIIIDNPHCRGCRHPHGFDRISFMYHVLDYVVWSRVQYQSFRGQLPHKEKMPSAFLCFFVKPPCWQIAVIHHIRSNRNVSFMNGEKTSQFSRSSAIFRVKKMQPFQTVGPHILNIHIWIQSSHTPLNLSPSKSRNLIPTNTTSTVSKSSKLAWHSSLKTPRLTFLFSGYIPSPSCCSVLDPMGIFDPGRLWKIHGNSWSFVVPHVLFSFILYQMIHVVSWLISDHRKHQDCARKFRSLVFDKI